MDQDGETAVSLYGDARKCSKHENKMKHLIVKELPTEESVKGSTRLEGKETMHADKVWWKRTYDGNQDDTEIGKPPAS